MALFTTLEAQGIAERISSARSRVVLAAPGIWPAVADALIDAAARLGTRSVAVVVDANAGVARLGFGEFGSIANVRDAGITVRQHDGLRLGVLLCDNSGWCFAMSAALVEKDPTANTNAFNAIQLSAAQVIALSGELPTTMRNEDMPSSANEEVKPVSASPEDVVLDGPLVGAEAVDDIRMDAVGEELKLAPPQNFDLSRQTNVYTPWVQFVELKLPGFHLRARQIPLPPSLEVMGSESAEVMAHISSKLRLFEDRRPPRTLTEIKQGVEALRKLYLIPVGMSDRVILKKDLPEFQRRLKVFMDELSKCRAEIEIDLTKIVNSVVDALAPELAQVVLRHPPLALRSISLYPTQQQAEEFVRDELKLILPKAEDCVEDLEIRVNYKDLTYATLKDERFRRILAEKLPKEAQKLPLVDEYRAAGARKTTAVG